MLGTPFDKTIFDEYIKNYIFPFENYEFLEIYDNYNDLDLYIKDKELIKKVKGVTLYIREQEKIEDRYNLDIPEYIEYIKILEYNSNYTYKIPNNIKYLYISISINDIIENKEPLLILNLLTSTLQGVTIQITDDNDNTVKSEIKNTIFKIIIQSIPKNIEYLETNFPIYNIHEFDRLRTFIYNGDYNIDFDNLPLSLERLEIESSGFESPLDNLPISLKVLAIDTGGIDIYYDGYKHTLDNLPPNLEVLFFPETITMNMNDLPANLNNLPNNLKCLALPMYLSSKTDYNNLPDSLEIIMTLIFDNVINKINHFPSKLKKIYYYGIYDYLAIDSYIKKNKNLPFEIYRFVVTKNDYVLCNI